jgi:hypothetical protein
LIATNSPECGKSLVTECLGGLNSYRAAYRYRYSEENDENEQNDCHEISKGLDGTQAGNVIAQHNRDSAGDKHSGYNSSSEGRTKERITARTIRGWPEPRAIRTPISRVLWLTV